MPYRRTETYTTTGTKPSWNVDPSIAPFDLNVACSILSGTAAYKMQYTLNPLDGPTEADTDATWFDFPDIPAGTAVSAQAGVNTPVARIRVVISAIAGSLKVEALQGLSTN